MFLISCFFLSRLHFLFCFLFFAFYFLSLYIFLFPIKYFFKFYNFVYWRNKVLLFILRWIVRFCLLIIRILLWNLLAILILLVFNVCLINHNFFIRWLLLDNFFYLNQSIDIFLVNFCVFLNLFFRYLRLCLNSLCFVFWDALLFQFFQFLPLFTSRTLSYRHQLGCFLCKTVLFGLHLLISKF